MAGDGYDFLNNVAIDHNLFALQVLNGEILDDRNIEDGVCAVAFQAVSIQIKKKMPQESYGEKKNENEEEV